MKPTLIENYIPKPHLLTIFSLLNEVNWINIQNAPRYECFMSDLNIEYSYANEQRKYISGLYHKIVKDILDKLNSEFNTSYNACFLNRYDNEKNHLGWHADDFTGSDLDHPIAVISFGVERYIWVKDKNFKGVIPQENRFLLTSGSLFIMPAGYQKDHLHRIPKHDRICGPRVSLTYRKFI
jgi:alkylated DNA repair dioxygenase AlkB